MIPALRPWERQPHGDVQVDSESGPSFVFFPAAGRDLVGGAPGTRSLVELAPFRPGIGAKFAGSAGQGWVFRGDVISGKQHTIMVVGNPRSQSSQRNCAVNQRAAAGPFVGVGFNQVAGAIGAINISQDAFSYHCFSNADDDAAYIASAVTGKTSAYLIGRDGTSYIGSIDGVARAPTVSFTSNVAPLTANTETKIGDLGAFSSTGYGMQDSVYLVVVWPRFLSQAEANFYTEDPNRIFKPQRIWVPVSAGGGDVTLALSGEGSTASAGTLANSRTVAASGQAATASAGTVAPSVTIALSGQSVTASSGTVTQSKAAALSGQAVTASAGTLAPSASIALSGQAATASAGTVTYTADGNVTLALSGQAVAASAGTVAPAATVATSGQAATVSAGTAVAGRSIAASGTQITTAAGTLTLGIVVPLSGQAAAAGAGTVTYSTAGAVVVALTGQAVEANAGTMSYAEQILSAAPIGHGPGMSRRSPSKGGSRAPQLSTRTR